MKTSLEVLKEFKNKYCSNELKNIYNNRRKADTFCVNKNDLVIFNAGYDDDLHKYDYLPGLVIQAHSKPGINHSYDYVEIKYLDKSGLEKTTNVVNYNVAVLNPS